MQREQCVGVMWVQERWWEDELMNKASLKEHYCLCDRGITHIITSMNVNGLIWIFMADLNSVIWSLDLSASINFSGKTYQVDVNFKDQRSHFGSSLSFHASSHISFFVLF